MKVSVKAKEFGSNLATPRLAAVVLFQFTLRSKDIRQTMIKTVFDVQVQNLSYAR